MIVLTNSG